MKKNEELSSSLKTWFSAIVIPLALVVAVCIYIFILGNGSNFMGGNSANAPLPGNYLATVYKGGFIVPILMSLLIIVLTFTIERFFTISKAKGKGSVTGFVKKVRKFVANGDIEGAVAECNKQRGSVANVILSVLMRYKALEGDATMTKDQKLLSIQKEIEEATSLELPGLEQNLVILATITSVSTLLGLLGTVLGMIRAFAALAQAGAPDSVALATGISEALINTAFGIGTAALAVVFYNVFTTQIDKLTYSIDEAGFSIVQTYAEKH
ncbi:MAG: MotA/TolQ/ExbB proton channel family protein [Bacteroidetes bacterium]|nr:MotA/TolQ/ExbB proton channel family protein [Bacteroidota bacterium]